MASQILMQRLVFADNLDFNLSEVLLTDYFNQQVVGLFGHDSDDLE